MNTHEQFVQVCGLVEGMDDLRDNLTFRFHPLEIGDVPKRDDNAFNARLGNLIVCYRIKPVPTPVFASQAAAFARLAMATRTQFAKTFPCSVGVVCVDNVDK